MVEESTGQPADREPAALPQAAASQSQVPEGCAPHTTRSQIPATGPGRGRGSGCLLATGHSSLATVVGQEMDLRIRSMLADGLSPRHICLRLRLRQRFGIRVQDIDRYRRQLSAAGPLPADGFEHRAGRPHANDAAATQRPVDSLTHQLLHRLSRTLSDPDLTPDQIGRLANAITRQRQAEVRLQAQKMAGARYGRQRARDRKSKADPRHPTPDTGTMHDGRCTTHDGPCKMYDGRCTMHAATPAPALDFEELRRRAKQVYGLDLPPNYGHEWEDAPPGRGPGRQDLQRPAQESRCTEDGLSQTK